MAHEKNPPKFILFIGAFVFKDNKLLLAQRSFDEGHLPGYWAVPGGKVDLTDTIVWNILEKTAQKEILEETGVQVADAMVLLSNNSFVRTDGQPVIAINFICQYVSGTPQPLEDTIDVKWIGLDDVSSLQIESGVQKQIKLAFSTL